VTRNAEQQAIRGPERALIELHRRALDAVVLVRVVLEAAEVRRDDGRPLALAEDVEERASERRPLERVRPRAELVEEDERARVGALDDVPA